MKRSFSIICLVIVLALAFGGARLSQAQAASPAQSTPSGVRVEAYQDVNVRSGPGTQYDLVGIMARGQAAAILGKSPNGLWLKVNYIGGPDNTGWVYRDFVRVAGGEVGNLPVLEAPPTPTVRPSPTPLFGLETTGTPAVPVTNRLPTYTPPAPVPIAPLQINTPGAAIGGLPPALVIGALLALGVLLGGVSLLQRR